jgi:hypothetical protein
MNRLVDPLAPCTAIDNGFARFLAAVLIAAVVYVALVMVWRIVEGYVMLYFFHTAERAGVAARQGLREPGSPVVKSEMPASVGTA